MIHDGLLGSTVLHMKSGEIGAVIGVEMSKADRWSFLVELRAQGARDDQVAGILRSWFHDEIQLVDDPE